MYRYGIAITFTPRRVCYSVIMKKLSTYYRTDTSTGLDPEIKQYLDNEYLRKLKNIDASNPNLLVVYSGGSAVGKSSLSARIGDELDGLVIENDAVKRHILLHMPGIERDSLSPLTWRYTMDLYSRLHEVTRNGLIVRDGIIDWYFDRILPVFERAGYQLFIVGYDMSRDKSVELIERRGDTPTTTTDRLYKLLDDQDIHIKRFRAVHRPDILLNDQSVFDHDRVITELRKRLSTLN